MTRRPHFQLVATPPLTQEPTESYKYILLMGICGRRKMYTIIIGIMSHHAKGINIYASENYF